MLINFVLSIDNFLFPFAIFDTRGFVFRYQHYNPFYQPQYRNHVRQQDNTCSHDQHRHAFNKIIEHYFEFSLFLIYGNFSIIHFCLCFFKPLPKEKLSFFLKPCPVKLCFLVDRNSSFSIKSICTICYFYFFKGFICLKFKFGFIS